ncbi:MAG TPA: hypothetical protein VMB22_07770 [Verrucomicrobiae bacterium]|nr:hypothetical protein [Verrucomicrobiae bacterium]
MTGGLLVKHADQASTTDSQSPIPGNPMPPGSNLKPLWHLLDKLKLTPDQKSKIEKIISDGQAQISGFWKTNGEPMIQFEQKVKQQVVQQICVQLTSDQQKQFEDLWKHPPHRTNSTNSPPATNSLSKASSRTSNKTPGE